MAVVILHVHEYGERKKKGTRKFKSGGLHEKQIIINVYQIRLYTTVCQYDSISIQLGSLY